MTEQIEPAALHEVTQERYLSYALSVITARALPDVRDGLKPVQRRILYAMFQNLGLTPDGKHRKSAAVVGEVMAKLHPHGDQAIYDAMVRMAQPFSLRYPLVDGQGNFGSLDGDQAAAMRYTEAKLRHLAVEILAELRKDTVAFRPNYDGTTHEPVVLPAQVPQLLINGATGIAVGMATNIPPHHLGEVVTACMHLIDHPEASVEDLVGPILLGPDFPTGGELLTPLAELRALYATGHGTVEVRGTYHVEEEGRRRAVVITSIPYAVNKSTLVTEIADHIRAGRLPQVADVRDESTDEVRVVLDLQRGASEEAAMAYLYRRTALQTRFHVNMTALSPQEGSDVGTPSRMGLLEILHHFNAFRREVIEKRLLWDKAQLDKRIHLLEGFVRIFDALDEAIALIRSARNRPDAQLKLMDRFSLDEIQADAILDTRLYRLAQMEIHALRKELAEKVAERKRILDLLASDVALWGLVRTELDQIRAAYADERRTSALTAPVEVTFHEEDYIVAEDSFVIVTREGWWKRQRSYTELGTIRLREGDTLGWVMPTSTKESIVLFTDRGRAYTMRAADIPQTTGYGEAVQTRFDFADGETLIGVLSTDPRLYPPTRSDEHTTALTLTLVSQLGRCLQLPLSHFAEPSTRAGRLAIRLEEEGDRALCAEWSAPLALVSMASRKGRCLVFPASEINLLGSAGKGVMAMKLGDQDVVLGATLTTDKREGLVVETNRGRIENVRASKFGISGRGNRGRELLRLGHLVKVHRGPVEWRFLEGETTPAPPPAAEAAKGSTPEAFVLTPPDED